MKNAQKNECHIGCRLTKRLLGQILVDGEFVPPKELETALEEQKHTNNLLGETLVRMGTLDPRELDTILFVQRDFASLEDAVKAAAGIKELLGGLLIRARRITPGQLELALSEQIKTDEKLGGILVRLGIIKESELDAVLTFQHYQGSEASSERFRLGEILVAASHITSKQLEDALVRQNISKKKIGEVLVEAGYAEPHHIEFGLSLQKKLVTAALIASLSLSAASYVEEAVASDSGSSSARITVTATVQARASLKVINQIQELIITNADIRRGHVDIPGASSIEVRNNSLSGYFLVFEGMGGPMRPFREISVQGLGREVQIDFNGGMIAQPNAGQGPVTLNLGYRFILSKDASPGTYSWPLTLSVMPR